MLVFRISSLNQVKKHYLQNDWHDKSWDQQNTFSSPSSECFNLADKENLMPYLYRFWCNDPFNDFDEMAYTIKVLYLYS